MTPLGHARYCDELQQQTAQLTALVRDAAPGLPVPTCPGWTVAGLLRHIGGNLLAVGTAVRTGMPVDDPEAQVDGLAGPEGDEESGEGAGEEGADAGTPALCAWVRGAAEAAAEILRAAGPVAEAQVWGMRQTTGAWARRAAHDVVVHRADAAAAVGAEYTVAPEVAADAVEEFLDLMGGPGMAPRLAEPYGGPGAGRLRWRATDTGSGTDTGGAADWTVELCDAGFRWHRTGGRPGTPDVEVSGDLADVLRVLYRRLPPGDERVTVTGDAALLGHWLDRVSLG
ncbi:hypothetical protein GCM10010218_53010 [Streptomyces mashuensis]|uniref:Maleylpyruvate isomerase family mycothiol-dependent enzyme n=1 Tax=Streptomyces mashuensis TaxID=33904 RepID=A0A919EFD8_9ACTN|nr:maleylpyruvate isomerase N-terminal domain-containing protein [Streptomyces mashuensis]GHF64953.1 hypothetical protein GCM10010218_53010 [Streptomyces mashuensis]